MSQVGIARTVDAERGTQFGAEAGGVAGQPMQAALQQEAVIGSGDKAREVQASVRQVAGMAADRRAAGAVQLGEHGALGGADRARHRVLDGGDQLTEHQVVLARGDADDALAGGRHHAVRVEHDGRLRFQPEPTQPGQREQARRAVAAPDFSDP